MLYGKIALGALGAANVVWGGLATWQFLKARKKFDEGFTQGVQAKVEVRLTRVEELGILDDEDD